MIKLLKEQNRLNETLFLGILSLFCFGLSLFRFVYSDTNLFLFLNWNLFLAAIADRKDHLKAIRLKSEIFWKLTPIYAIRPKEPFEKTMEFLKDYV